MSVFRSRPALRWLVPAAAVTVILGAGTAVSTFAAAADPALPERSAAQLLVDLQTASLEGLSGTVVQSADLGLPAVAGLGIGTDVTALLSGTHTLRVWYSGPDSARLALLGTLGETDVIRNGQDVWIWESDSNSARHLRLPADSAPLGGSPSPTGLPSTPQEAADAALAAIGPSTEVTTGRSAKIAGRDAYELVLTPRDTTSLVGQVRLAIDATEHVPLRVEVLAAGVAEPAFKVAFTQVDFARPSAEQFQFNPPAGAKITETSTEDLAQAHKSATEADEAEKVKPRTVGTGWTTVVVVQTDETLAKAEKAAEGEAKLSGLLEALPEVSGDWGSGRIFTGTLFSVLLTEDGRLLAGAVKPERLYQVAAETR